MTDTFHYNHSVGFVFGMLSKVYEVFEELVYIGHIEVTRHNEVAVYPVVFAQERVHILDAVLAKGTVAHVPHYHFAYVGEFSFLQSHIVFQCSIRLKPLVDTLVDARKDILHRLCLVGTNPTDIAFTGLHIQLDARHSCAILPTVVLLLQHQVHFIDAIEGWTVFFFVIFQRFEQADKSNPALVFDSVTHLQIRKGVA